jgi:hypothetical protein
MPSVSRQILPSEHDPVRFKDAHNNLDRAVRKAETTLSEVEEKVAALDTAAEAITNASTSHALNAVFSDTEVEAALDALGTKINAILAALRALA